MLTIDTSGAVQVRTDACVYEQPETFRVVAATAGEMGLRGGGIEGLMGRWVGGTMDELPVVTARATASPGGQRPKELPELNGGHTGARPECIRGCKVVTGMLQACCNLL